MVYSNSENSNFNTLSLVNCATVSNGDDEFCNCNTCSENEGHCDAHDECQGGLVCGTNNCPNYLGFDYEVDCCYHSTEVGDENFCTNVNPCEEDEGDCDSYEDCQTDLDCGSSNCPASLGLDSEVDCCYPNSCPGTCEDPSYEGDFFCDDQNNNCGCEWDGGDCCGNNVKTKYCSACQCLDPNNATTTPVTTTLACKCSSTIDIK